MCVAVCVMDVCCSKSHGCVLQREGVMDMCWRESYGCVLQRGGVMDVCKSARESWICVGERVMNMISFGYCCVGGSWMCFIVHESHGHVCYSARESWTCA